MNQAFSKPGRGSTERNKYGLKFALLIMAILVGLSLALVFVVITGKTVLAKRATIPPTVPVSEEKFLSRFGTWGVISNFRVTSPAPGDSAHKFSVEVEFPNGSHTDPMETRWYIEVYQSGKLINVIDSMSGGRKSPQQYTAEEKRKAEGADLRGWRLSIYETTQSLYYGDRKSPYQFLTFVGRHGSMRTAVPITSVIGPGSHRGSDVPVAYQRNYDSTELIELSNPRFELSELRSNDPDYLTLDYEIKDDSFELDYRVDEENSPYRFYLVIEDKYGSMMRYTGYVRQFLGEPKGDIRLEYRNFGFHKYENDLMKNRPIKVYIARFPKREGIRMTKKVGIAESIRVFSNVLEIND